MYVSLFTLTTSQFSAKIPKDHAHHLQLVFDRLIAVRLKMKASKCSFGLSEIKLLGYIANKLGLTTEP